MGWVMGFEPTNTGTTIRGLRPLGDTHHILFAELFESFNCVFKMARQKGLEPLTYCLEGSCSIQLSYWRIYNGAGDGNRTRVSSLEGWCSTIELHPQIRFPGC